MAEDQKSRDRTRKLRHDTAEYHAFLERRIPELQAMGKKRHTYPKKATMGERCANIRQDLADSQFPGMMARRQADTEWYARA